MKNLRSEGRHGEMKGTEDQRRFYGEVADGVSSPK